MNSIHSVASALGLLVLSCFSAQAQSQSEADHSFVVGAARTVVSPQPARYAGHDSLMVRVNKVRSQADARMFAFKSTHGTFGGLHRRVKCYDGSTAPRISNTGVQSTTSHLVKTQVTKRCYGIELEKVRYYDPKGRLVLSEQYEGHQLTRLQLLEYPELLNIPTATWLLVGGDYLMRTSSANATSKTPRKTSYYFYARPNAQ